MSRKRKIATEPTIQLSHRIALVPEQEQAIYFGMACGTSRFTWNWALAEWNRQFDAGLRPNSALIKKEFNAIKYQQYPWLTEIHRDAHAEPFNNLGRAWAKFFKDCKEGKPSHAPVFKKKGMWRDSFYVANDKFKIYGKEIILPIVGKVKMTEDLRFKGKLLGATVSRSADRWFVSIQVEMPAHQAMRKRTGANIEGADLGITAAVTLSTTEKILSPKPLKKVLRRLKIKGRSVSRKLEAAKIEAGIKPGEAIPKGTRLPVSSNRKKASARVAKTHYRVTNIRKDFTHKLTDRLCRENQALGLEDLNVAGTLKNHRLALAISDVGFGEITRQLKYKAPLYGTTLVFADRWFPSSKMCHVCWFVHKDLKLSDREWTCPNCGVKHDRDVNAALNLKQLATVETALPAASSGVIQGTDVAHAASGGKVTPVSYDAVLKKDQGRKKNVHLCAHSE
jgi:putative transposase